MNWFLMMLLLGVLASGCRSSGPATGATVGASADWIVWKAKRLESVAGPKGWTTLVGLHWVREGPNFAGSDPTNDAVFPRGRAAANVGLFVRTGRIVHFEAAPGTDSTIDGKPIRSADLLSDANGEPTKLRVGPLTIVVIERGERIGLRVRDPEAAARIDFRGLDYFPYDPMWRIVGRFEPFATPRTVRVQDVTGGLQEFRSPGAVVFPREGAEHRLEVVEEPGERDYFVIFRDATAGKTTYAAGRFLYVPKPDPGGHVVIDFNRGYTPPCGFTAFATCPLPPRQNWLPFPVRAGELKPASAD